MENFENLAGNGTVIYPLILLIAIAGSFFFYNRMSLGQTLQSALVWGMIFLGAVAIYGMWEQLSAGHRSRPPKSPCRANATGTFI